MNTIARTRRFVKRNKTVIVFVAGTVMGAATVALRVANNETEEDVLVLPDGAVDRMKRTGERILYPTHQGDLLLSLVPQQ